MVCGLRRPLRIHLRAVHRHDRRIIPTSSIWRTTIPTRHGSSNGSRHPSAVAAEKEASTKCDWLRESEIRSCLQLGPTDTPVFMTCSSLSVYSNSVCSGTPLFSPGRPPGLHLGSPRPSLQTTQTEKVPTLANLIPARLKAMGS